MLGLLYIRNTNTLALTDLANGETSPPTLLGANYSVTVTLLRDGTEVAGQTWPQALSYQGAPGYFSGRLSHQLTLNDGDEVDVLIKAWNDDDGVYGEWNGRVVARVRGER